MVTQAVNRALSLNREGQSQNQAFVFLVDWHCSRWPDQGCLVSAGACLSHNTLTMKSTVSALCARFSLRSSFTRGLFFALTLTGAVSAEAQLVTTLSETYNVPHVVDGGSLPVFFDFSSTFVRPDAVLFHTTLSLQFTKAPDLSDDPPFYSEIGLTLRSLSPSFSILRQVTLVNTGTFNDGDFGASFSGTLTFDDSAPTWIGADPDHLTPGIFQPLMPLGFFGNVYTPFWELVIDDATVQNPLLFRSATLTVFTAVPEPSTTALAGAGLLGVVILVRLRRRRTAA